jgi:NitT/TauT family transport system substrate-binding protein
LFFGSKFIAQRPEIGRRFMVAYVRGLRYYYEGLRDGHYYGANGQTVVSILAQYTPIKDPAIYADMIPAGVDPNGYLNVASMEKDRQLWAQLGELNGTITASQVVDLSFVDAANRTLGKFRRN